MRIICLLLGVSLAVNASHAALNPKIAALTAVLNFIAPSIALPTTNEVNNVQLEDGSRMGKKARMANPYEDDEFEETSHGLMSDTGASVKSYVVQHPEAEEEEVAEKRSAKKSKTKKQPEDSDEVEEEEEEADLERKDSKKSDVKYTYDPEYLEQGYLLPVAVKGKKDRKDTKKKNKKKYEEESEEEEQVKDKKRKGNKDEESEEEEADEEAEDEEEDDEPQGGHGGGQGGKGGKKKDEGPPAELVQTLLDTYGFLPESMTNGGQGGQGGQGGHGGPGGPGGHHGGQRPGGYGGGPGGPPGGPHGHGGPDGPHYDFPPSRTPGAKYDYGTAPPDGQNYGPPPQNYGPPNSQEQQPSTSLVGSLLSRLNPFKRNDQQEYNGGPNGPPQGQYGGPPNGQYGGPPNGQYGGPPQGQFNGPPPNGQYGGPPQGQSGPPPPRGPPSKKHKHRAQARDGPQSDFDGPENYQGPNPYNDYNPNGGAEISVKPLMSRLQSVFGMGGSKNEGQGSDPFISVRY